VLWLEVYQLKSSSFLLVVPWSGICGRLRSTAGLARDALGEITWLSLWMSRI
jgi:hypothetical protein